MREPNVVRLVTGRWMLVDLEAAAPIRDGNWPGDVVVGERWKPTRPALRWEPRHDLWQLAHVLVPSVPLPLAAAEDLAAGIDACTTVEQVLQLPFFG